MRQEQNEELRGTAFLARRLAPSLMMILCITSLAAQPAKGPTPLLKSGQPVNWWFVFKLNAKSFPECGGAIRACPFGGTVQAYNAFSQQFAYASSDNATLATGRRLYRRFDRRSAGRHLRPGVQRQFLVCAWNDQFYGDPIGTKSAPAGHSKGMLAWNKDGNGVVLQVATPDWPAAAGSSRNPRPTDGNTLGCILHDNDVLVSQHFFALKLNKNDVMAVLKAPENASVVTDPANLQVASSNGPADIRALVQRLGKVSSSKTATMDKLSSGVLLISKPSNLNVPPWQMVSAKLDGEPLRAATWWTKPEIPTTTVATPVGCWDPSLTTTGRSRNRHNRAMGRKDNWTRRHA